MIWMKSKLITSRNLTEKGTNMKKFKVLTTSTVTRRYVVEAENKEDVTYNLHTLKITSEEIIDTENDVVQVVEELEEQAWTKRLKEKL